jgi:ParB family transcriptional regulator, chromosome partitioning protein
MAAKHGLGRGLSALIKEVPDEPRPSSDRQDGVARIAVGRIHPSPWQPRRQFSREALDEMIGSIREHGVLQPLLARQKGDDFELIAGERRLRAAVEAGLADVPVIVMEVTDNEALELALIENLQRQDLNVIEEAEGYKVLAEKFGMTQEQIAQRVGKARASVTNTLRLLQLPDDVRRALSEGVLSPGHAKVLMGVPIDKEQSLLAQVVIKKGLSVRDLERIIVRSHRVPRVPRVMQDDLPRSHVDYLADRLHHHFGTSIRVIPCRTLANGKKAKGMIEIDFYSSDDLDRVLHLLGLTETP